MSDKIVTIYKQIAETAWWVSNQNGLLSVLTDPSDREKIQPLMVEDASDNNKKKNLVLPVPENLVNLDHSKYIVMHPLAENIQQNENPVTAKIRHCMSIRLNWIASELLAGLLDFAASPKQHDKLSPDQMELIKVLKNADETSLKNYIRLINKATEKFQFKSSFVSVYLTKGRQVGGHNQQRAAVVKFPIYEAICKAKGDTILDTKGFRKKDLEVFKKLFESVFPGIENEDCYTEGSNSRVAPYMDCLMRSFGRLFNATNELLEKYKVIFEKDYENLKVKLDWMDSFQNLEDLGMAIRKIPAQRGNDLPFKLSEQQVPDANVQSFKSTAERNAAGQSIVKESTAEPKRETVSMSSIMPPWEPIAQTTPAVATNPVNQTKENPDKVSFRSTVLGAMTPSPMQQMQMQQQMQQQMMAQQARPSIFGAPQVNPGYMMGQLMMGNIPMMQPMQNMMMPGMMPMMQQPMIGGGRNF